MNPVTIILTLLASTLGTPPRGRAPDSFPSTAAVTGEVPSVAAVAGRAQDTTLVMRRVWSGRGVDGLGSPTPDGSHLTFVDWATGNLALRDMATGKVRYLTHKGISDSGYAELSVVSPDGRRVAYHWYPGGWTWELRVVDIDGSNDKLLIGGDEDLYVAPEAWSPDGRNILVRYVRGTDGSIALVSPDDGSIRELKRLTPSSGSQASFSPDGRYVVYDLVDPESSKRDIFLLSVDTGREVPLVRNEADDPLFGWVPGSDWVLFGSDRTGTLGAWAIRVEDGRPAGDPVLVKPDIWRAYPTGFTADGSFYYVVDISTVGTYVATVDTATGSLLSGPTPLDPNGSLGGGRQRANWSPDGRRVAYWKTTDPSYSPILGIRSMETGETRELEMKFRSNCRPRWSPDGLYILCGGRKPDRARALYQVDAQTGAATVLRSFEDGGISIWYDWAPEGSTIYYKVDYGEESRIVHLDPATGTERVLRAVEAPTWISIYLAVSPDGAQIAFWESDGEANRGRLLVMPTEGAPGKEVREVFSTDGQGRRYPPMNPIRWSRDGRYLLQWMPEGGEGADLTRLWRIPTHGGAPEHTNTALEFRDVLLSPDGRRVVFEAGEVGREIWVMKNYLPRN